MKKLLAVIMLLSLVSVTRAKAGNAPTLKYFGQSCFLITTSAGVKIVIDPHAKLTYPLPQDEADVVLMTHEHFDHNNFAAIKGKPEIIHGLKEDGDWNVVDTTIKGVKIVSVSVYHDEAQGTKRGKDTAFVLEFDGIKLIHVGDLGHVPEGDTAAKLSGADFLCIPVGGHYTIGPDEAIKTIAALKPKVVVPMHYQTARTRDLPIQPLDVFLKLVKNTRNFENGEATLVVPKKSETWILRAP